MAQSFGRDPSRPFAALAAPEVLAYRIQVAALGGPDKATLRVIRQPKGRTLNSAESGPFEAPIPSTREGSDLRAGALLIREWKGKLERVTGLEKGFAWNGKSYAEPFADRQGDVASSPATTACRIMA